MAYVWTPGEGPLALPPQVGALLGGASGYRSYVLEIHYDNPTFDQGVLDSSGVRMYYTPNKREHDLGVLQVGDPLVELLDVPIGDGLVSHTFNCPASCATAFTTDQEVTVFRELLHMHASGVRMYNRQMQGFRTKRVASVDFFDFDQQGSYSVIQEPYTIQRGDSFQTRCFYNSQQGERFGLSSQEEMCMAFLFYYPRQLLFDTLPFVCGVDFWYAPCSTRWESSSLADATELQRSFGTPNGGQCRNVPNVGTAAPVTLAPVTSAPVTLAPVFSTSDTNAPVANPVTLAPTGTTLGTQGPATSAPVPIPTTAAPTSGAYGTLVRPSMASITLITVSFGLFHI